MRKKISVFCACLVVTTFLLFPSVTLGNIILFEDFNDGSADGFQPMGTAWMVENGTYRCDAGGFDIFSLSKTGDRNWGNYIVECDIMVEGSINQVLAFRVQNPHNFYDINLRAAPYNDVVLTKVVHGMDTWHRIVEFNNSIRTWHHIKVSAIGSRIEIEIDGCYLFHHVDNDDPYMCGGIALVGYTGGIIGWQTALFDNVVVFQQEVVATKNVTLEGIKALFR